MTVEKTDVCSCNNQEIMAENLRCIHPTPLHITISVSNVRQHTLVIYKR